MITIGIASYDQQEYLCDAIESALNQTVPCEVIVCDDGSNDHSLEIARKYPVKVVSQVNKGLSSARNTCLMNSSGDFFLPLDADDILQSDCVEKMLKVFNETDADIVAPSMKCFGKVNDTIILMPNPKIEDFKTGNRIPYCSAIKRSKILEVGGYNPKMVRGWEDYDLWFDLLKRGAKIVTIPEPLLLYRTKEKSMWTETKGHEEELWGQIKINHPTIF